MREKFPEKDTLYGESVERTFELGYLKGFSVIDYYLLSFCDLTVESNSEGSRTIARLGGPKRYSSGTALIHHKSS